MDKKHGIAHRRLSKLALDLMILLLIGMVAFPLMWMALSSLKPSVELFKSPPTIFPKNATLEWYRSAFSDMTVIHYFVNSFVVAMATMLINVLFGTLAAYSLTKFQYRGRKIIVIGVLSAYCIPPIMLMIPLYRIIAGLGLSASLAGVVIGHLTVTFPFSVWLLMSFFRKIPNEISEAAMMDGATDFQTFYKVNLPLCVPGVLRRAFWHSSCPGTNTCSAACWSPGIP